MSESTPITSQPLSDAKRDWLAQYYSVHSTPRGILIRDTRSAFLLKLLLELRSLADPTESVYVNYEKSDKGLWDGEPDMILNTIPTDFWEKHGAQPAFPCRGELTDTKKRAFIGEFLKDKVNKGDSKHGKVNLRKITQQPVGIDALQSLEDGSAILCDESCLVIAE